MSKKVLGRGLDALIPVDPSPPPTISPTPEARTTSLGPDVRDVALRDIIPNPSQPRRDFDEEALLELAASIREYGVIEPVLVRPEGAHFVLVAGERRVRAARLAGLESIPALLRDDADEDMLTLALIENIQREDLNAIEEAEAYRQLMQELGLTQDALAERVGKSRAAIANALRLLQLPTPIRSDLSAGRITAGHARAILSVESPTEREALWKAIKEGNLTVRGAERAARERVQKPRRSTRRRTAGAGRDLMLTSLEERFRERLATQVKVLPASKGGKIEISYFDVADLNRIAELMGVGDEY